jgi:hypothetical protein
MRPPIAIALGVVGALGCTAIVENKLTAKDEICIGQPDLVMCDEDPAERCVGQICEAVTLCSDDGDCDCTDECKKAGDGDDTLVCQRKGGARSGQRCSAEGVETGTCVGNRCIGGML